MRVAALVTLAILTPVLAQAAEPPTLVTYTLSHDTIYPSASVASALATSTAIDIAFSEAVKASIKVVSSSGELIKSLYTSSSVTNPTPKIWDGMNTGGTRVADSTYTILISATSTASGTAMTDASKTIRVASDDATQGSTEPQPEESAPAEVVPGPSSGTPAEYLPIPVLRIMTLGDRTVTSGADTAFSAAVYDGKANRRDDAIVTWSFGDGMQRTGASVFHAFYEPGEYAVVVRARTSDGGDATITNIITAKDMSVRIASVSARGVTLTNSSTRPIDLSFWRISMGGSEFKIPADTQILAGHSVLFPIQVIQLTLADTASLLYPSGEVAATYPAPAPARVPEPALQPASGPVSYSNRGKVESVIRTEPNIQPYENAALAPAASTYLAAAGAALPAARDEEPAKTNGFSLFRSPWIAGLLGVMAVAGGAFILL